MFPQRESLRQRLCRQPHPSRRPLPVWVSVTLSLLLLLLAYSYRQQVLIRCTFLLYINLIFWDDGSMKHVYCRRVSGRVFVIIYKVTFINFCPVKREVNYWAFWRETKVEVIARLKCVKRWIAAPPSAILYELLYDGVFGVERGALGSCQRSSRPADLLSDDAMNACVSSDDSDLEAGEPLWYEAAAPLCIYTYIIHVYIHMYNLTFIVSYFSFYKYLVWIFYVLTNVFNLKFVRLNYCSCFKDVSYLDE